MKYTKILLIKLLALSCFIGANLLQADEGLSLKAKGKETIELRFNGRMQAQYDGLNMNDSVSHSYYGLFYHLKNSLTEHYKKARTLPLRS